MAYPPDSQEASKNAPEGAFIAELGTQGWASRVPNAEDLERPVNPIETFERVGDGEEQISWRGLASWTV